MKKEAEDDMAIIIIEFSENYCCKLASEVQTFHFGGSREQASLHTGVIYIGKKKTLSFCTISDSTRHDPSAVWAHMEPVFELLKESCPNVTKIHLWSDGPTTQYRNKKNFYLFTYFMNKYGYTSKPTWNMFEAGHGKGAADAIGGVIKRMADSHVNHGNDIKNPKELFHILEGKQPKVKLFFIDESNITAIDEFVPSGLKPVPGTMKIHQVVCTGPIGKISKKCTSFCMAGCCPDIPFEIYCVHSNNVQAHEQQISLEMYCSDDTPNISVEDWCIVEYDEVLYPGMVLEVGEEKSEYYISTMKPIGDNKFVWPRLKDELWYPLEAIRAQKIEKPRKPTPSSRYFKVSDDIWQLLTS